jgi:hypothetical protein
MVTSIEVALIASVIDSEKTLSLNILNLVRPRSMGNNPRIEELKFSVDASSHAELGPNRRMT